MGVLFLGPGDRIGHHLAGLPRRFCVVAGRGLVGADAGEPSLIAQGRPAFWRSGKNHEVGTVTGLVADVVQVETLDPGAVLSPL